jgi:hypothetical protein
MNIYELDRAIYDLMEKVEFDVATVEELRFLKNISIDIFHLFIKKKIDI